ncbi:HAD family hydrolase [Shewanella japonica]|uniref:Phosphatase n=1 Tax=Shewanella japonica TaxID=93973 RepID=A0ABM6JQG1_9GAMM|nr:HAD family hydrolase [Shewanella japonica]ARD23697.1 phosphatase [Shewanella japonica]
MSPLTGIQGVIFDLDGTLVESELNFTHIKQELACPLNIDILDFIDALPTHIERQRAHDIIIQHETNDALNAKALPNMHPLLNTLKALSLPCAIVTRNSKAATATKLTQNNIDIDLVLTRECYPAKPAPDALLAIAKQWQLPAKTIIYVGDYLYDIQAAKNAGMTSVFINHHKQPDYQTQADVIVNNLAQLQQAIQASNPSST